MTTHDDPQPELDETDKRLDAIPPYGFAELERKIRAKARGGVDVISLGIATPIGRTTGLGVEADARSRDRGRNTKPHKN